MVAAPWQTSNTAPSICRKPRCPPAPRSCYTDRAAVCTAQPDAIMAQPLQKIIANRYGGRNLPVTLVLPDGGRVPLSSEPEVEILARTWRGLKALAAPAMGALARAYVHNDIDFTGSARRAAAIAEAMVGEIAPGREALTTRWRIWRHQRRSNRANIGYHYDVSNAFYRLFLDRQLVYSCAYFAADGRDARGRADGQARSHLPEAAPCAGRALPRHRLRLGGARVPGGNAIRRRGDRDHAVEESVRIRDAARSRPAGSPAACTSSCATISICPRTRSTTRSRASGCSSMSASRAFRSISARSIGS